MQLKDIRIGKVDGKHEFISGAPNEKEFFDAYLLPDTLNVRAFVAREIYFVQGFRGTGKTSFLRYFLFAHAASDHFRRLVLFKSDLTEQQRISISRQVGIEWADTDSDRMALAQDFKDAWAWFVLHKIGEINPDIVDTGPVKEFLDALGLGDKNTFDKVMGFLPKIEGSSVRIKANIGLFEAELGADTERSGKYLKSTLFSLCLLAQKYLLGIKFKRMLFIAFDELEVFHISGEQFQRDLCMVRDILFIVDRFSQLFITNSVTISLLAAVRSEVLDAMGSVGQEVDRVVHDRGTVLAWHYAKRSLHHPLLNMLRKKLAASEREVEEHPDIFLAYFPTHVQNLPIEVYLLDRSFYKPRDLIWRLSLGQRQFPLKSRFDEEVLTKTEQEYSSKLWDEIQYELSAIYNQDEITAVRMALSGMSRYFDLNDFEARMLRVATYSKSVRRLYERSPADILVDLYRLGAIGNAFRVGTSASDTRNRWVFRGDPDLLVDKRMELNPALSKHLSAVDPRKRGPRKSDRSGRWY